MGVMMSLPASDADGDGLVRRERELGAGLELDLVALGLGHHSGRSPTAEQPADDRALARAGHGVPDDRTRDRGGADDAEVARTRRARDDRFRTAAHSIIAIADADRAQPEIE